MMYNHLLYAETLSAMDCSEAGLAWIDTQAATRFGRGHLVGQYRRECGLRNQRQEQAVLAPCRDLKEAVARILFRGADDYAAKNGELVCYLSPARKTDGSL